MRLAVLVIALASTLFACHGAKRQDVAWPAASTTAEDGGQSVEPKPTAVASAIEDSESDEEESPVTDDVDTKPAASPTPDTPAATAPPTDQPKEPEVILSEEIIIEIED